MSMTMAKNLGRVGFKDLEVFKKALIAKQCWRLMVEPYALWARVLKKVYFHNEDFLKAKKCGRVSWTWSNLLMGNEFLSEHILRYNWIPGLNSNKLGHPGLLNSPILKKVYGNNVMLLRSFQLVYMGGNMYWFGLTIRMRLIC